MILPNSGTGRNDLGSHARYCPLRKSCGGKGRTGRAAVRRCKSVAFAHPAYQSRLAIGSLFARMFTMSTPSIYLAEELLALPAAQRELLANLLFDSLKTDGRSDEEIAANLRSRLERLKTGADAGLSFEQVFGEAL